MSKKPLNTQQSETNDIKDLMNIFDDDQPTVDIQEKIKQAKEELVDAEFETVRQKINEWNTDQAKQLLDALISKFPSNAIFDTKRQEMEQKIFDKTFDIALYQIIELYNKGKYEEAKAKAHLENINRIKNHNNAHKAVWFLDKVWKICNFWSNQSRHPSSDGKYIDMCCNTDILNDNNFIDKVWFDMSLINSRLHEKSWIDALRRYLKGKYIISRQTNGWGRRLEIVETNVLSPEQEKLYQEICSKIETKLEEKEMADIDDSLKKVKILSDNSEYGKAMSLMETIKPKTADQQDDYKRYARRLEQNKEKATIQQIALMRKEIDKEISTASSESLIKKIETVETLLDTLWDKKTRREYMTFPEKDIFLALREAFLAEDEETFLRIYGILLLKPDILNQQIYDLKSIIRNSPLKDKKLILPKKEIDATLGIHRPLFGLGKIKTDEWDEEKMFISKVKKIADGKNSDGLNALYYVKETENINATDSRWYNLLMWAASEWYEDVAKLLLKHPDIDVNKKNDDTYTALIMATANNQKHIVELLLQHPDIDPNIVEKDWDTPLSYARKEWYANIEKLLLKHPKIKK